MYSEWLNMAFLINIKNKLTGLANRALWNDMRKLKLFGNQHGKLVWMLKILVYSAVN